jgi:alpha-1,2-mannosyltransferase
MSALDIAVPLARRTDDVHAKMLAAGTVFFVIFLTGYYATGHWPYDTYGYLYGRDFVNTWMGAQAALSGDPTPWFDFDTYVAALRERWPTLPEHNWGYPPHLLLFTWPLGLLPYFPAYAAWTAAGYAIYLWVAAGHERRLDRLVLLAVAPAVAINLFTGQNGFFTAALLIGGLTLLDRRPLVAGILFGILTTKPQLGLLLPLMLLLTGRWRVIVAASTTALVLAGVTTAIFGTKVWTEYFNVAIPMQQTVLRESGGLFPPMAPTIFMNARVAGLPLNVCWALQGLVSAAAVAAVTWTYVRWRDAVLSTALFVTAAFLATPYAVNYDMVVFGWVLASLRERGGNAPLDEWLAFAVWTLPVTCMLLGVAGIPGSALVLVAFAARLFWRLGERPATAPAAAA